LRCYLHYVDILLTNTWMGDKVKVIGRRTGLSSAFALRPFTLERLIFFTSPRQVLISVIRYAGYQVLALLFRFF